MSDLKTENIPDYFTTDFLLLEHGEVWDIKKLKSMLKADDMKGVVGVNDFDFILVKVKGDFAWMAYHNIATFEKDGEIVGEMNWLESATAVKKENGWRIDMLHSTRMPKAE